MVLIDGFSLKLEDLVRVARHGAPVQLTEKAITTIREHRAIFEKLVEKGTTIYGVNTGVGAQVSTFIEPRRIREFQVNLLRSHAAGVGEPLPEEIVRGAMLLRLNTFAQGYSAVRVEVALMLEAMLNAHITPLVPETGSLGASGDLAPGAHIALTLIGEGEVYFQNERMAAREALQLAGLKPLELEGKEGLALINGTHVSTAAAAISLWDATTLAKTADIVAALSLEAYGARTEALHPLVHEVRPQPGQSAAAYNIRRMLEASIHVNARPHQDPYSMRCTPQVHSAYRQALEAATHSITAELNACSDNPIITSEGEVLHTGNFHGQQIAQAMDLLTISLCELALISKGRVHLLLDQSDRNPFLAEQPGVESGYMMCEYTSAALISEMKSLVYPSSVESVAVSGGQEDHASMSMTAAMKARRAVQKAALVLGAELVCALRGLELKGGPRGMGTVPAYRYARGRVKSTRGDHPLGPEIEEAAKVVLSRQWLEAVEEAIGPLV